MAKGKPAALVISDTHCMPSAWVGRPGLVGDAYFAFEQAVDYAIKKNLPLLILGDIIDSIEPPPETVYFLRKQMDRMAGCMLQVKYILGNHESTKPPWLLAVHDWPECVDGLRFSVNGVRCYGISFTPFDRLPERLADVPKGIDVLLCHQAWTEFMGTMCRTDGSLAMVPHAKLVLTGDYHKCETLELLNAQGQPMRVLSPGSLVQTEIRETEPRQMHVLYEDLTTQAVPLTLRRPQLEPPVLHTEEDLEGFIKTLASHLKTCADRLPEELPENLRKPIIRVTYDTRIPEVYRRLETAVGDEAFFFKNPLPREQPEQQERLKQKRDAVKAGLVGCLQDVVPDKKSELYLRTRALLEAVQRGEKPSVALQQMRKEFLEHGGDLTKE